MEELGFDRREGNTLIFFDASGSEFELIADETLLHEVRAAVRATQAPSTISAAQVQTLLRQGNSRAEVALQLGCDPADVEPYEHPVIAEIEFTVGRAKQAPVRVTGHGDDTTQEFGDVLTDRLRKLGADQINWSARKDLELGWQVLLEFVLQGQTRTAIWNFELPTQTLSPANKDAVSLTKQGNVADALIPRLRALGGDQVDDETTVDSTGGSNPETITENAAATATVAADEHDTLDFPQLDEQLLDHTKNMIKQSATSNAESALGDVATSGTDSDHKPEPSETQDLLNALRQKRGNRLAAESNHPAGTQTENTTQSTAANGHEQVTAAEIPHNPTAQNDTAADDAGLFANAANQAEVTTPEFDESEFEPWNITGVSDGSAQTLRSGNSTAEIYLEGTAVSEQSSGFAAETPASRAAAETEQPRTDQERMASNNSKQQTNNAGAKKRRRKAMPSWDDILFGTRSEEDPN